MCHDKNLAHIQSQIDSQVKDYHVGSYGMIRFETNICIRFVVENNEVLGFDLDDGSQKFDQIVEYVKTYNFGGTSQTCKVSSSMILYFPK